MQELLLLIGAFSAAFACNMLIGPPIFARLQQYKQPIREVGPKTHQAKSQTPTMGGLSILLSFFIVSALLCTFTTQVCVILAITFGAFCLGAFDDWQKLRYKNSNGVSGRVKLLVLGVLSVGLTYWMIHNGFSTNMLIPFTPDWFIPLGLLYPLFSFFVIVGTSNAVNLTDGLDGLVTIPIILTCIGLGLLAYLGSNVAWSAIFGLIGAPEQLEIAKLCAIMAGASLAFLWFNCAPAQIFMGDTGSLAQGAFLGSVAVCLHQEWLLFVIGGLFVIEALSVMIQVGVFKRTKKRVFKMAPIHHHFELAGLAETKVVVRFWICAFAFLILGLVILLLRGIQNV